jgi:hypothetical protein
MYFMRHIARNPLTVNPHHQVAVAGELVVFSLLLVREIPMRVEAMRVAREQEQFPGAVPSREVSAPSRLRSRFTR